MKLCSVCGLKAEARGLCHRHYNKLWSTGTLEYRTRATKCSECDSTKIRAKGLCANHYMKLRRTGTFERFRLRRSGWTRGDHHRLNRYGITPEEFTEAIKEQEGNCAICCRPFAPGPMRPCQDHDHASGLNSGILCHDCNLIVGRIEKTNTSAEQFFNYIEDWKLYNAEDDEEAS